MYDPRTDPFFPFPCQLLRKPGGVRVGWGQGHN